MSFFDADQCFTLSRSLPPRNKAADSFFQSVAPVRATNRGLTLTLTLTLTPNPNPNTNPNPNPNGAREVWRGKERKVQ